MTRMMMKQTVMYIKILLSSGIFTIDRTSIEHSLF